MRRFLLAMVVLLMACGNDATGPTMASVAGVWHLTTVAGAPLPYLLDQEGADKLELTSDVFTTTASGTFTQLTMIKTTISGQVTTDAIPDAGSYSLNGNTITINFQSDGSSVTGTISDNTLTITSTGIALVYIKQ